MGNTELIIGFECSGNRRPNQGLIGNGRWTGVPLKTVLDKAGLKADAQEIVLFGADRGKEMVASRGTNYDVEQQYGRSLPRPRAGLRAAARGDNELILYLVSKGADVKAVARGSQTTARVHQFTLRRLIQCCNDDHVPDRSCLGGKKLQPERLLES